MTKKETAEIATGLSTRPIRRINLTLPILCKSSYEIYDGSPLPNDWTPAESPRLVDHEKKKSLPLTRNYINQRLPLITGPAFYNLIVEMPPVFVDSSSSMVDSISQALINTGYSKDTLREVPRLAKPRRPVSPKSSTHRSQTPSDHRLLYDSFESFEDQFATGLRKTALHPTPVSPFRRRKHIDNRSTEVPAFPLRTVPISPVEGQSKEIFVSSNGRLRARIDQITRMHYPSIQQLRRSYPFPELLANRMHLHREAKRDFVPNVSRHKVLPPIGNDSHRREYLNGS